VVPIHDLLIKDDELVLATHGRSFWILDDLTPLRRFDEANGAAATLFPPRPTYRIVAQRGYAAAPAGGLNFRRGGALVITYRERQRAHGEAYQTFLDAGQNPPDGVMVFYRLAESPVGEARLTFRDAAGAAIVSFTSAPPVSGATEADAAGTAAALGREEGRETPAAAEIAVERSDLRVPTAPGLNRFLWNMRYPDARPLPDDTTVLPGPIAPPGNYMVELTVDGQTLQAPFELRKDPRLATTQADFEAQFRLLLNIRDSLSSLHAAIGQIRDLRAQLEGWTKRARDRRVTASAVTIQARLTAIESELTQVQADSPLNFPARLREKLLTLVPSVASCDAAPTAQERAVYDSLRDRVDRQLEGLDGVVNTDLAAFNAVLREANLGGVLPLPV